MKSVRKKIGLALGSGGARGLAHIGVLKVFEENNIPIDFIAGSSIGALVGGLYVSGLDSEKLEEIAIKNDWKKIFSLIDPKIRQGFVGGEKIEAFIEKLLDGKSFEDCAIKFQTVATDLNNGEIVVFDKGKLSTAIRASISVPLAFKPVKVNDRFLVDGGLSVSVPSDIVRNMGADIVVAVNLDNHYAYGKNDPGLFDIANDSFSILRHHLALLNCENADCVIDIDVGKNYWYQFAKVKEKILVGEQAAKKVLPKILELIGE